MIYGEL
jgi:hypothetical protein